MINIARTFLDYTEMPVIGFLLDGKQTGFKTPVLQNGREAAIQDANRSGIVTGFIACGDDDIARVYRSNWPTNVKSQIGKEVVFVFKSTEDTFCDRRSRLVSRLLVEMRQPDSMTAADAINVMLFARVPYSRIEAAIDRFARSMEDAGLGHSVSWSTAFKRRVRMRLGNASEQEAFARTAVGTATGIDVDLPTLENRAIEEVNSIDEPTEKEAALKSLDRYYKVKAAIESKVVETRDVGARDLYLLSATIDMQELKYLSYLINYTFVKNCWGNFLSWNGARYKRKIKIETPDAAIARAAIADASDRLTSIAEVFGAFKPFVLKGSDGKERDLPKGLVLRGKISTRDQQGNYLIASGRRVIEMLKDHASVALHNNKNSVGEHILFTTRGGSFGTCRGVEFVRTVIELFFPSISDKENPIDIVLGASNSWIVLRTSAAKYARLISGNGVYTEQIKEICGARRLTVIRKSEEIESEMREFSRAAWRELEFELLEGKPVLSLVSRNEIGEYDPRKLRTFASMWEKLFPDSLFVLRVKRAEAKEWRYIEGNYANLSF